MREILRRHWLALGARHGILTEDGREVRFLIDNIVARTPSVIAAVSAQLPAWFPAPVAESIFRGLQDAARRLAG